MACVDFVPERLTHPFKVMWKDRIGTQRTTWFDNLIDANNFRRELNTNA